TGLSGCWRRYGLVASASVLAAGLMPCSLVVRGGIGGFADRAVVGRLIRFWMRPVEPLRELLQVPVHRPDQRERADHQHDDDQQSDRAGLAEVGAGVVRSVVSEQLHGRGDEAAHWSVPIPANRSVSGRFIGTRDLASSNSSVGQSLCCHSMGALKKSPEG